MDKDTRNAIERATQRARKLLEEDFAAQLEGEFDVHRDGTVAAKAGSHLSARQAFQRERIIAAIEHKRAAGMSAADAARDYLRDTAFTTLNRFVALKMLEARDLVQECITKGEQSAGYSEFCGMAAGLPLLPDSAGYRLYIESLFDELSTEVKVLFDRRDPSSVLWPKRVTFEQLLEILNITELARVWGEDETIGWVYQFFNGEEDRKKMRVESQVPRNSRELAVRNQFFTPRYVVQFLTDNTLGRLWYEMREANTALAEKCEYMVRKQHEEFALRIKKDPRDLRILDPACGSGHFLLYAFDLLLEIYEEAYADPLSPKSEATGKALADDYPSLDSLRMASPGLILAHNLYGVDVDSRCAQIAQFALWMRAQKAYRDFGIARTHRTQIRRTNVVIAEPLVAHEQIAREFVGKLDDVALGAAFMSLIESLNLAGDLGILLHVERMVGQRLRRGQTANLFTPPGERLRAALTYFASDAGEHGNTRQRLFTDDAKHGVSLLGVVEERFDAVLMNPPFGDMTSRGSAYLKEHYGAEANDAFAVFVSRAMELLSVDGVLGAVTSRTGFFATSLKDWRRQIYDKGLYLLADLGEGVMDAAMVEAAAYCIGREKKGLVFRHLLETEKASSLLEAINRLKSCHTDERVFDLDTNALEVLPDSPLVYWVPPALLAKLASLPSFEPGHGAVRKGLRTGDNFRFVRAHWEVSPDGIETQGSRHDCADGWVPLVMTGASQPWFSPIYLLINWQRSGRELRAAVLKYGSESRLIQAKDFYFRPGFSWTRRAVRFFPYAIPPGCIFTGSRPMAFPASQEYTSTIVALFASRVVSAFLRFYGEQFARPNFLEGKVKLAPMPKLDPSAVSILRNEFKRGSSAARQAYRYFEPFLEFVAPKLDLDIATQGGLAFDRASLLTPEAEKEVDRAFGITASESDSLERDLREALSLAARSARSDGDDERADDEDDAVVLLDSPAERAWRVMSYGVGCLFGRWNIDLRHESAGTHRDNDAYLSPVPDGYLERKDVGPSYPIPVNWVGIVEDEPGGAHDIVSALNRCLGVIGMDPTAVSSAIDPLQPDIRTIVRKGFFDWHKRTYTLGKRKAPIYWQLATPSTSYSVWLYIHSFSNDTLFRVQNDYVAPKLAFEERRLESLNSELRDGATAAQRKSLAAQEAVVEEIRALLDEVKRIAPLWKPSLDDGVIINFAPLWRLVPHNKSWQKELKSIWDALCAEKFDWAHLAMHLWPERVVPKCAEDRSLAIAHGLEDVFWVEDTDSKWIARKTPARSVEELVRDRISPAVKSALNSLLEAPTAAGKSRARRGGRRNSTVIVEGRDT